jgi:hypothetical protein
MGNPTSGSPRPLSRRRLAAAWAVALAVDGLQVGLAATTAGMSMLLDKGLDMAAALVLWRLLGWHWALVPSFAVELLPVAELAPTWTAAVWLMTRKRGALPVRPGSPPP